MPRAISASSRHGRFTSRLTAATAACAAAPLCLLTLAAGAASAVDLAYSFESDLQGFAANGGGISVNLDTIGATEGTQSMEVAIVQGATFVGALTDELEPFIGDPPGLDFIRFDLTITEMFPEEAAFVNAGVTIFGSTQPDFPGGPFEGLQAQFFDNEVALQDLEVGTHEIQIDLQSAPNPITFELGQSFNDIVGVEGSGQTDLIPTGFQIYINKSADAAWTGYFDNIRVGSFGEVVAGDYNGDSQVTAADYAVWRDNVGFGPAGDGTTSGDSSGVPDGTVDISDYNFWVEQFDAGSPAAVVAATPTPEPTGAVLLVATLAPALCNRTFFGCRRNGLN